MGIYDVKATWRKGFNPVILRINTYGWTRAGLGQVGVAVGGGHNAYLGIARDWPRCISFGADPLNSELELETTLLKTLAGAGWGHSVGSGGISCIHEELLDIKGKASSQPVYRLSGGKCRARDPGLTSA